MRTSIGLVSCVIIGAVSLATAAAADPYYYRDSNGSWTNSEYNNGNCHIYYSHNGYDGETHVNRYGDCGNVAVGPNGEAYQVAPPAVVIRQY